MQKKETDFELSSSIATKSMLSNNKEDNEGENNNSTSWFEKCLTIKEEEHEWREVKLRFDSEITPVEGQLGSVDNSIKTSKYTLLSWIPKGTLEQFRRLANVYFLGISIMMIIGTYTTLFENSIQYITTLGPLIVIIGFTLVKEGLEDKKRHQSDNEVNSRKVDVVISGDSHSQTVTHQWRHLQPGMVVLVRDRDEFPADLVCLASSDPEGKCYIETANIDGETNLKLRKCAPCDSAGTGPGWQDMTALLDGAANNEGAAISFEPPNPSIHTFGGTITTNNNVRAACGASELCLRGALLRNTKWVLGVVVYTGRDTKLVMNSREVPSKLSTIEQTVNKMIYFILFADILLTTTVTIARSLWEIAYAKYMWYLCQHYEDSTALYEAGCTSESENNDASYWATFFILFNNFLPLSLYVTLEVVNFVQAYYVDQDQELYDPVSNTPALARTSNQNGDLGQIEYIFSDKTGTLTCNEMKFRRCSVGGLVYGNMSSVELPVSDETVGSGGGIEMPKTSEVCSPPSVADSGTMVGIPLPDLQALATVGNTADGAEQAQKMGELLATCHNVVVEKDEKTGKTLYQAESPDEEALVDGGITLGYTFLGATSDEITVGHAGAERIYKHLATIPFNSARKRMSVLIVTPEGEYRLYCKGADNVMFDRAGGYDLCGGQDLLDEHLEAFSNEGLRTLVLAYRILTKEVALDWLQQWNHALTLPDRDEACSKVSESIEVDLEIIGATAIEDRLQDGVPATIADLKEAGIKVWVLTGDKMTTAINIGFSCRLLTQDMELITLDKEAPGDDRPTVKSRLATAYEKYTTLTQDASVLSAMRRRYARTLCGFCGLSRMFGGGRGASSGDPSATGGSFSSANSADSASGIAPVNLHELDTDHLALIVDGPSLLDILADDTARHQLLQLGCFCKAVIACRVSPAQKQLIVKMVKDGLPHHPITLSIGDGANDVPMIQEAQIGVGISGKEGRQAVNSSDFAIAQFRFLKRLLLVHGRYNYRRISKVIIYSFYKNIVLVIVLFLFACYSSFSGQSLYGANSWCYSGYNFFLGLPPFMLGFFDRDVKPRSAMTFHKLYYSGLKNEDLNVGKMVEGFIMAIWDGALIYFLCLYSVNESTFQANGKSVGINVFGNQVFACMVFAMLYKICLLFASWNAWSIFSIFFSIAFYITFIFAYSGIGPVSPLGDVGEYDFYDIPYHMFGVPAFWLLLLLVPVASFVGHFVIKAIRIEFFTPKQIIVSEHEYLTQHLSVEDRLAIEESFRSNKNFSTSSSTTDDNTALNNDNDMNSSMNGVADEAPQVKIDLAVLDKLHGNMSMAERTGAGHMANRKLRSSFVDNTPAEHSYFARDQLSPRNGNEHAEGMGRRSVSTRGSFNSVRASASPGFETPIAE
jgi:phospholipid-translocating P-type ATPase (flippase)